MLAAMRVGWPQFGRKQASVTARAPDNAVAAPPTWLLGAAIVASAAALLGTSEVPSDDPVAGVAGPITTYVFNRNGIDGGFVELSRDAPTATFYVTLHADDLGPDGATSTDEASVSVEGTLTTTGLDEGTNAPAVDIKLTSPDGVAGSEALAIDDFARGKTLLFTGDCAHPKSSADCTARFAIELARQDQGDNGGVVRFDWLFDVQSKGSLQGGKGGELGPFDPPWTIEVSQP
jgi:hypothetical protein